MQTTSAIVTIIGKVYKKGFYIGKTEHEDDYMFFSVRAFSNGKFRNIPCVLWSHEVIQINDMVKIKGDLTFLFSGKANYHEMKVHVFEIEKLTIVTNEKSNFFKLDSANNHINSNQYLCSPKTSNKKSLKSSVFLNILPKENV